MVDATLARIRTDPKEWAKMTAEHDQAVAEVDDLLAGAGADREAPSVERAERLRASGAEVVG